MTGKNDPNPPSRRDEDFPKTTTIPEGWMTDDLMDYYNRPPAPASDNGADPSQKTARADGQNSENTRPIPVVDDESLFTRRLDPFPKPNTIPTGWDLSRM
jgi:hypothetical protein